MERKVKYDYAFKLECVKLVLEEHYSNEYVSKLKGLGWEYKTSLKDGIEKTYKDYVK